MRPLHPYDPAREPDALSLGAATWLACGIVLLGLTPLPLHAAALGWSPAFWLLAAPCVVLLARRVHLAASRAPFSDRRRGPPMGGPLLPAGRRHSRNRTPAAVAVRGPHGGDPRRRSTRGRALVPDSAPLHSRRMAGGSIATPGPDFTRRPAAASRR